MRLMKLSFTALILLTFSSIALAQKDSRLCGYLAKDAPYPGTPQVALASVYEARKNDIDYSNQCKTAQENIKSALKKEGLWEAYEWKSIYKDTCEDVGKFVTGPNTSSDVCDKMTARCGYMIQYLGDDNTVYSKKGCK